ncbi:choice-of-anchor G family protein [uncultured Pseudokineococcus sp.]|uniref:choice-of-anchor G family protein n=1 Tax=uncultured Pseudokineococcus sp. TaxID=1642928 RepID=UPI0026323119|nr:choice-of-anchor G family protein [uncultured Pseudokineococcus sp.]
MTRSRRGGPGSSRARLLAGAGALAVVVALLPAVDRAVGPDDDGSAAALPLLALTDASWLDQEHVRSSLVRGVRDCTRAHRYSSTASSRMLSGSLLGTSLDPLAALSGVSTTHTGEVGTSATAQPSTAPPVGPDAHAAPLSVTAVRSAVSTQVASALVLPAPGQEVGLLQQHARAASDGEAAAATGAVTDGGVVRTTGGAGSVPDGSLPDPATLDLAALAPGVASLAGVRLQVGALASTAMLDGCLRDETGAAPVRDYGIAGLRLVKSTPTVAALRESAVRAASNAQTSVTALEGRLVTAIQGVAGLAGAPTTVKVHVDVAAAVQPLLSARLGAGTEVVVDMGAGTVEVDLDRLLAGQRGLNGRAPSTELVLDQALVDHVAARTAALVEQWAASVQAAVDTALRAARVTVDVALLGVPLLTLDAPVSSVLAGTAKVRLIGLLSLGVPADVAGLVTAVVVRDLQAGLFGPTGVVAALGATVRSVAPPVTDAARTTLLGVRSAMSLVVNDQRDAGGVHDVTALRVRVLPGVSPSLTDLRLATSSVGPVVERP